MATAVLKRVDMVEAKGFLVHCVPLKLSLDFYTFVTSVII